MNDNNAGTQGRLPPSSYPHGQAALLLVESLIHGLCERSILSTDDAIEIIERAVEVQSSVDGESDGANDRLQGSHTLLAAIAASLRTDEIAQPPSHDLT